ncbi:hypothetical protein MAR_028157 [Mya arenaria]|uniref:F5/8 type C domain-containing protein n=1 Tax=Mya arenaria TaxID=6604 RepID=A0ABY7DCS3_MYAAR|nr:hypothetical protein MAR_028157 [Mya arenaria]
MELLIWEGTQNSTTQPPYLVAPSSVWRVEFNLARHGPPSPATEGKWEDALNWESGTVELNEISDVRGIVTKARDNADGYDQYVTSYGVSYSMDCVIWRTIDNFDGIDTDLPVFI